MLNTVFSIYSLLLAIGILLMGSGLLGTLLSLRANTEGFSNTVIGIVMSAFFVGDVIGAYICPRLLRNAGYIRAFAVFAAVAAAATLLHGLVTHMPGGYCVLSAGFLELGALYAKWLGFDDKGIAAFIVCVIIGGVLLQYPIGHRSDLHDRRVVLMLVSFIACVLACLTYFIPPAHKLAFFTMALLYGGFSFSLYSISVAHTQDLIEADLVMDATRTLLLFNGTGAATGPSSPAS